MSSSHPESVGVEKFAQGGGLDRIFEQAVARIEALAAVPADDELLVDQPGGQLVTIEFGELGAVVVEPLAAVGEGPGGPQPAVPQVDPDQLDERFDAQRAGIGQIIGDARRPRGPVRGGEIVQRGPRGGEGAHRAGLGPEQAATCPAVGDSTRRKTSLGLGTHSRTWWLSG